MDENQIKQAYSDPTQKEAITVVNKRDEGDTSTSGEASEVGNDSAEISLQTKTSSAKNDGQGYEKEVIPTVHEDWDDIANIPTIHFSFIVNLTLPKHAVSIRNSEIEKEIEKLNIASCQQQGEHLLKYIPVGSNVEGYQIPPVISKGKSIIPKAIYYSDLDVLLVWGISKPLSEKDSSTDIKQKIILETEGIHPGYCRLFVNDPEAVLKGEPPSTAIQIEGKLYFSALKVRNDVKIQMQASALRQTINAANFIVDQKGPAVGIQDITDRTLKIFRERKRMDHWRQEFVAALPITWPKTASDWKNRVQNNEWLTDALTTSVIENGCHVVPVPHRHSTFPDVEWRLSFATSEVQLAKEAVTGSQRQCYIYLKVLRQVRMSGSDLLSSYHFKTAFLYSCERLPVQSWEENPACCIFYILDLMIKFVKDRWLPSYFIPENNLLDHLTEEEFQHIELLLVSLRTDPISPVLEFTDTNIIAGQSMLTSIREILKPVLNNFPLFKLYRNKADSLKEFRFTLTMFINGLLLDDKIEDVVHYVVDFYEFLQKYLPSSNFGSYISGFVNQWKIVSQDIRYLQIAIEECSSKYPDVKYVNGTLGGLYHLLSLQHPIASEMNLRSKMEAESYFSRFLCDYGLDYEVTIEYALFLLKIQEYQKCECLLEDFIRTGVKSNQLQNIFNLSTIVTLESRLGHELYEFIQQRKIIAIPSLPLAHYLLTHCKYFNRNAEESVQDALEKFRIFCLQSKTFWSHYLYALSLSIAKKWREAEVVYGLANQNAKRVVLKEEVCHVEALLQGGNLDQIAFYVSAIDLDKFRNSLVVLVEAIAFQLHNASSAVTFVDALLDILEDNQDMDQGNIACLHFASAFEFPRDSEENLTALIRAETLFSTFLANAENKESAANIDYAAFLCQQQRWPEAKAILENYLQNMQTSVKDSSNSYGKMEYNTVDEMLQREIDVHSRVIAPSSAFACYFLLKCYLHLKESEQKIKHTKNSFKNICEKSKNANAYSLLGYIEIFCENWYRAEHWFCKAVERKWEYTVAKQMISYCRSMRSPIADDEYEKTYVPLCIVPELRGRVCPAVTQQITGAVTSFEQLQRQLANLNI